MVFAVGLLGLLVVGFCCYCLCYRKCCKKKKKEEKKAVKEKVDLKAVQMLAASYQEKVQPSVDELDYNSDEFQSDGSSGVKIGIKKKQLFFCFLFYCRTPFNIITTLSNCKDSFKLAGCFNNLYRFREMNPDHLLCGQQGRHFLKSDMTAPAFVWAQKCGCM